jgi:hypothetical protein
MTHRPFVFAFALAFAGCATTSANRTTASAHAHAPPDVHGDPLALLPHGAVAWTRIDAATLRASPYFEQGLAMAHELGADTSLLERELGFDAIHGAERVALAVYLPPDNNAQNGWPLVYARGTFDRAAILAAAAARPEAHGERSDGSEHGVAFTVVGNRAYMFPAPDVMLVMERALARRVAARLSGESQRSVLTDDRFTALWRAAGGIEGPLTVAIDLNAIRPQLRGQPTSPEADALEALVARGEAPDAVTVHAVERARDGNAAHMIERTIDDARGEAAGQLAVRLLGLSRVLREGIRTAEEGNTVRVDVDMRPEEARRVVRASALVREFMGGS